MKDGEITISRGTSEAKLLIPTDFPEGHLSITCEENAQGEFFILPDPTTLEQSLTVDLFLHTGASAKVWGIARAHAGQTISLTVNPHHRESHTSADVLVKAVVEAGGQFHFKGLITIEEGAQQAQSYLANHVLLMAPTAVATTVPSLQIGANDVKASHGATVGHLDENILFYLMSRGVSREEASQLVVEGFLHGVVERIEDAGVKTRVLEARGDIQKYTMD